MDVSVANMKNQIMSALGLAPKAKPFPGVNASLPSISRRAERLSASEQADTFVSLRNVEQSLLNRDHRILFGRRGTGKTHILSFVASKVSASGDIAISLDMRKVGSNGYIYTDETISQAERATRLLRDFIEALSVEFLEIVSAADATCDIDTVFPLIESLSDSVKEVLVVQTFEEIEQSSESSASKVDAQITAEISLLKASGAAKGSGERSGGSTENSSIKKSGVVRLSISMGATSKALSGLVNALGCRVWVLIDEWSALPETLQPYLADFIKRVLFPIDGMSVCIAAIEQRAAFRKESGMIPIGIELGSDAFADINLDDYLVFENNPEASLIFFKELIYRHLRSVYPETLPFDDADALLNSAFSQRNAFSELVRASEGVPRDFINILQIAATKSGDNKISIPAVRNSAKDWYDRDKAAYIDSNKEGRELIHWIIDIVIAGRKARGFLVRSDVRDPTLDRLFDERLLHIAKRSYSAAEEPGIRYKVWKIDFGCYADLINTSKAPTGFLFEDQDVENLEYIPEDDLRAVRRSILDLEQYYARETAPQ